MNKHSAASRSAAITGRGWGIACGVGAMLIWGVQAVVSRQSVADGLGAGDVTILRYVTAAAILLPWALRRMRPFPVGGLGWRRALILTGLIGPTYSILLVGGAHFAPALHSSLITPGLVPVCTALLVYLCFGERASAARLAGLALILCGIALFSLEGLADAPVRAGAWIGDAFFVLVAVLWSVFGVLARRWKADPLEVAVATCLLSLPLLPLIALAMPGALLQVPPAALLLQALYQGVAVGILALILYTRAVALLGAASAAVFMPLVPIFTAIAGALFIGEWPTAAETAGLVIALCGMLVALRAPAARPA